MTVDWINALLAFGGAVVIFLIGVIIGIHTQNPEDPWEDTDEERNIWDSR